jgi:hypothetical protein
VGGDAGRPGFGLANILYYVGALLAIGALSWFMTVAWEGFGGSGIFLISVLYAAAFVGAGHRLWNQAGLKISAGLLVTIGVSIRAYPSWRIHSL